MRFHNLVLGAFLLGCAHVQAATPAFEVGAKAIHALGGCYLVDYSYSETESLKPGYTPDTRVYDVNKNKSIKEWIYTTQLSPNRIRVQHILFGTDLAGNLMVGSELRHQAEDWEFDAPFLYEFIGPSNWIVKNLSSAPTGSWTRRVTNLDDGLRYQCSAEWKTTTAYAEWTCSNYAPIPGRETRDMSRRDYNTLERGTRVMVYGSSWLERQSNTKTIHAADGTKTPLVKEEGKNWYVRLPDSECAPAKAFASTRTAFWEILRETWDSVLIGDRPFIEKTLPTGPRYGQVMQLEQDASTMDLTRSSDRQQVQQKLLQIIKDYRAN
jgi:hypothetical protein